MLHASHCINVRYRAAIAAKNMGGKVIIFDGKGMGMWGGSLHGKFLKNNTKFVSPSREAFQTNKRETLDLVQSGDEKSTWDFGLFKSGMTP